MLRSLLMLLALGTLLLIGATNVGAQQTRPAARSSAAPAARRTATGAKKKLTPGMPVPASAKRSSANAPATTAASPSRGNNADSPNMVNANGSIGSQEKADGKGQGAYAAPGMTVKPARSPKTTTYDGQPTGTSRMRPAAGSTLKSGRRQ